MPNPRWKPGQSGNPKGRPPWTQYQKRFREIVTDDELRDLLTTVLAAAKAGDMQAAGLILSRMVPTLRPASEPVNVELPVDATPLETALAIIAATAGGTITPADGKMLLDGLAAVVKIQEVAELIPRIEAIEGQL